MTIYLKQQIQDGIESYKKEQDLSQNQLSTKIGVSSATLSQIKSGNFDNIADAMWNKIANGINFHNNDWQVAQTANLRKIFSLLTFAKENSATAALAADAGQGKTQAFDEFKARNKSTVHVVKCSGYWSRCVFLHEIGKAMGLDLTGTYTSESVEAITKHLSKQQKPLLIFDEVDKLTDNNLYFIIDFYNRLDGKCGIYLSGTPYLQQRLELGVRRNKKGYREIYSRIGRKFASLNPITRDDVTAICANNGIDSSHAAPIFSGCDGDLRRVKRSIEAIKAKAN